MMRTLACGKSGRVARSHHQPWFLGQIFNPLRWRCHLKRMGVKGHDDYAPLTVYYTHLVTRMSYVYGYIYIYIYTLCRAWRLLAGVGFDSRGAEIFHAIEVNGRWGAFACVSSLLRHRAIGRMSIPQNHPKWVIFVWKWVLAILTRNNMNNGLGCP